MDENNKITLADLARQKDDKTAIVPIPEEQLLQAVPDAKQMTPELRKQVDEIKGTINLLDTASMVTYGTGAQRQLTQFADNVLTKVRSKDTGYVGESLSNLLVTVQSLDVASLGDDNGFFAKLGLGNTVKKFMARYQTVETQIDKIEDELDKAQVMLLKDITTFDQLYEKNLNYFQELDAYIIAGEEKLTEAREEILPALRKEAETSDDQFAPQLVRDFEDQIDRFDRKIYDLKISKTIALQTAPQIRLIQNNDKVLVDKVQTAVLNTIPLWKNQIVIALGLHNQKKVLEMQRQINDTTNDLLLKNSELLKTNTTGIAQESQRGIADIETLKQVNQNLIETISDTIKINQEGRAARQAAELELVEIETNLKETMMANMTPNK